VQLISTRRLASAPWVQKAIAVVASEYLRLIWKTSRFTIEPADIYERLAEGAPFICATWHGQHFMTPFFNRPPLKAKVLVSRHRDGEINAIAIERLGIDTIRGSGAHDGDYQRKGGVAAFKAMLQALNEGYNVALTADVPKVARVAGEGIVRLAAASGRPIVPVAVATRNRIELNTWDRSALNLPFGRGAMVAAEFIRVPREADEAELEAARCAVEAGLNAATERAYALVDRRQGADRG
jgi:lysophospholipid acyltransferase (LPLAT)-like uncharacterized protein